MQIKSCFGRAFQKTLQVIDKTDKEKPPSTVFTVKSGGGDYHYFILWYHNIENGRTITITIIVPPF